MGSRNSIESSSSSIDIVGLWLYIQSQIYSRNSRTRFQEERGRDKTLFLPFFSPRKSIKKWAVGWSFESLQLPLQKVGHCRDASVFTTIGKPVPAIRNEPILFLCEDRYRWIYLLKKLRSSQNSKVSIVLSRDLFGNVARIKVFEFALALSVIGKRSTLSANQLLLFQQVGKNSIIRKRPPTAPSHSYARFLIICTDYFCLACLQDGLPRYSQGTRKICARGYIHMHIFCPIYLWSLLVVLHTWSSKPVSTMYAGYDMTEFLAQIWGPRLPT